MTTRTLYSCGRCGAQAPKWSGRCSECGHWGTMQEEMGGTGRVEGARNPAAKPGKTVMLDAVGAEAATRLPTGHADLDRILGGGLVPGSVLLLAGEPGVGKSTLLLALAALMRRPTLYVAGEESPSQIALRAARLGLAGADIRFLADTDADTVAATIAHERPALAIVDSVQTLRSASSGAEAASPGQVRASGATVAAAAKASGVPVVLVGQVTKDGSIAGPKVLEHLVDAVLSFEGDPARGLRILRVEKNRFGSADEAAIFRMTERGLVPETDPSRLLLADRRPGASGSAVACVLEGNRPLLVEVQALASKSAYATPIRRAAGFDMTRLHMLLAVLEKRAKVSFAGADVHVNAVGGLAVRDPAADLALALALASAAADRPLDPGTIAIGEIGLGGEVRSVGRLDRRLAEAAALGFSRAIVPDTAVPKAQLAAAQVRTIADALAAAGLTT